MQQLLESQKTALVVDDDEQVRRTLGRILEDRNYECRLASSAFEAREALDAGVVRRRAHRRHDAGRDRHRPVAVVA